MLNFRYAKILWIIPLGLAVVILIGPRVSLNYKIQPISLPKNIEQYLAEQEKEFNDIIPGVEKKIIWAGKPGIKTPYAVVYVHGFSATRQETAPLAELVANRLQANLFYTRMTGHGRTGEAMLEGNVNAWLNDTVQAFEIGKRLGKEVIMIGVSTGGTAVTWLASEYETDALKACILISPNFAPADWAAGILTWPWGQQIAEFMIGKERQWEAPNDRYWANPYPTAALLPMMGLVKLVTSLNLAKMKKPVLLIYSPNDQIVNPEAAVKTFSAMGSKRKKIISFTLSQDPRQHLLAGDILSPGTTELVTDMIHRFILA